MNILISGARGLVGTALSETLRSQGHNLIPLQRGAAIASPNPVTWDPAKEEINLRPAGTIDAAIHLAGESIAGRWTTEKKRRIRDSRVLGTQLLCSALAQGSPRPRVLISASAAGFYGDRGEERLEEVSPVGAGFLADVCREWESATQTAAQAGIRVVCLRLGIVLTPKGGALARMLPPFRLGMAGRLDHGQQWWSWITLEDVVGVVLHILNDESLTGPVNAVAPHAVTNEEFTRTLGRILKRPTPFPMPAFLVNWVFGEFGREALLSSARIAPSKLLQSGYRFRHEHLEPALRELLRHASSQNPVHFGRVD